jgi:hydantoinase/carbamoylase family amidase
MRDRAGTSIADAMRSVGLEPDRIDEVRLKPADVSTFVELHIEQSSTLEQPGVPIGVVTHIAAPHDLFIRLSGMAAHAGATPMGARRDAFAGAAEAAVELERIARASPSGSTVATVGIARVLLGAINVIPGEVELEVDIRDHDLAARTSVVDAFLSAIGAVAERRKLELEVNTITRDDPAACSRAVVAAVRASCDDLGIEYIETASGAYHDAMVLGAEIRWG